MSPLTWIVLLPIAAALGLLVVPANYRVIFRAVAVGVTGMVAILTLRLLAGSSSLLLSAPVFFRRSSFLGSSGLVSGS